jgi:hypothetical protein
MGAYSRKNFDAHFQNTVRLLSTMDANARKLLFTATYLCISHQFVLFGGAGRCPLALSIIER